MTASPSSSTLTLHRDVGWLMNRLSSVRADLLLDAVGELGQSPRSVAMLIALDELPPPVSQSDVAEALRLDPGFVAVVADRLSRDGLIERRPDPANRRRYVVELTERGRRTLTRTREITRPIDAAMRGSLSPEDGATLLALLRHVARDFGIV